MHSSWQSRLTITQLNIAYFNCPKIFRRNQGLEFLKPAVTYDSAIGQQEGWSISFNVIIYEVCIFKKQSTAHDQMDSLYEVSF